MNDQNSSRMTGLTTRVSTVRELFRYIGEKRLWGMIVLLSVLMLVSVVVIAAQAVSYLAPFVYTLF